ncbi:NADH dehydrogenase subunit D [Magnetococcus marinus MC-1]|uniref:NADH-quinone oxidoreductase subunit D n=1 Tax=Magnetococcus marinus (strain ATCC BAA-1437 / JCM 17883 / MC-1) TaxID=156889 RepID=NUOD_MAGMM|nr:RecName: Full=NADH-quinone oxidoreductase subunit D; AltName: Full=NADH dehydrogenase I subunit D; AltName: Full=NDH-1 subunit D [Magnetococcus marinus MC-1]ABK46117.1 NADH dehydrogenase subunit D [Magnetococcus marinus MC-1]
MPATITDHKEFQNYAINFGPQHPAAHGVLRLLLELDGEVVERADPHVGLLHRGTEKLLEQKTYIQGTPYFDRLDYMSMMSEEHAWVIAVERLGQIEVPERAQYIRTIYAEITRFINHLLFFAAHGLDVGAMTMFLYCFREREELMDIYEAACGARMHANYFRPGGVARDLPDGLEQRIRDFCNHFPSKLDEYETLLTNNRIWKQRLVDIGKVSQEDAFSWGFTGPMLRGSGVAFDLRKAEPYDAYDRVEFDIPVGKNGDSYDRYLVRIEECREGVKIIQQCLDQMQPGPVRNDNFKISMPYRQDMQQDMESMIHHFKLCTEGFNLPAGEVYAAVETPKGELGVYLVSDGGNKPYRARIRAAGFNHLQAVKEMARGHMIADVTTIIGSIDIVFGEIDR